MKKSTVRILCAVLGFLMVAGTIAGVVAGLITACGK